MQPDVIIIGSGMGGATLAAALAPTGRRILIIERGEYLLPAAHDRDANAIFRDGVFRPTESWLDAQDKPFSPGNYYNVGGNSKFYGAALIRYRREDFSPVRHLGGWTPGWPISYEDIEADYQAAETLYAVRGNPAEDPSEPWHSGRYPYDSVPDESDIANLRIRLKAAGLHPSSLPLGVDIDRWLNAGQTAWDAYPNTCGGKMDAETCALRAALAHENVTLKTGCRVVALACGRDARVNKVECRIAGKMQHLSAPLIVLAAGAVQSAALLLGSTSNEYSNGVANSSDQVGRNFMNHNCSAILAINPLRRNRTVYQKTLMLNDFYLGQENGDAPLGNIQLLGKITGPILCANSKLPAWLAKQIAARSIDFYAMSEDLPNSESRVTLKDGQIKLDWRRSNWDTHLRLVHKTKQVLRRVGFPVVLSQTFDRQTPSHQCGTAKMGSDPRSSVVDTYCRSHDHKNLFIVDASVLPTSAAVNPALTVAALALRAGRHIQEQEFAT
ncbi:MAG: FAD-dependent oxidoreductase [Granulosicoccus sp.]